MRAFVDTVETKEQAIAAMQSYQGLAGGGYVAGCHYYAHNNNSFINVHAQAERVHGIPHTLYLIEDRIFSGLNEAEAREWPIQYLYAINVGSDLSRVADKFILRILEDKERGVIAFVKAGSYVHSAVARVIDLYRRKLAGEDVKKEEWTAAVAHADYTAAHAAADYAAVAHAACTAAHAVDYTYVNALKGHYLWMRDVLLDIIRNEK